MVYFNNSDFVVLTGYSSNSCYACRTEFTFLTETPFFAAWNRTFLTAFWTGKTHFSLERVSYLLMIFSSLYILSSTKWVYANANLLKSKKKAFLSQKWKTWCLCWFLAAILVSHVGTPAWRPIQRSINLRETFHLTTKKQCAAHTSWYVLYLWVFCNISFFWLLSFNGFKVICSLRDSGNTLFFGLQMPVMTRKMRQK